MKKANYGSLSQLVIWLSTLLFVYLMVYLFSCFLLACNTIIHCWRNRELTVALLLVYREWVFVCVYQRGLVGSCSWKLLVLILWSPTEHVNHCWWWFLPLIHTNYTNIHLLSPNYVYLNFALIIMQLQIVLFATFITCILWNIIY